MRKKVLATILIAALAFMLCACGTDTGNTDADSSDNDFWELFTSSSLFDEESSWLDSDTSKQTDNSNN